MLANTPIIRRLRTMRRWDPTSILLVHTEKGSADPFLA
jgi:hypothetical protein